MLDPAHREAVNIERWRMECLTEAGYDDTSVRLLTLWEVDLHEAIELMQRDGRPTGCTIEQAVRILAPLDVPLA